jgi:hypothetical protein
MVYRKATVLCKLILYPATLLKLYMVSKRVFLVEFFKCFGYKITSSANRDSLTTSFPICIHFYFFLLSYCSGQKFQSYVK